MGLFKDIILSIPIGIIYNFLINKLVNVMFDQMTYTERYQKSLIFMFVIGLIGLVLAFTLFKNHPIFKNRPLRFGLILGSILLIFYSIISNWNRMDDITKIVVFGIVFGLLILYSYYNGEDNNKKKLKKKKIDSNKNIIN